ncbi:MAG: hypothetical protein ACYDDF_06015 [Thermoplasmatota archaeon]
MKIPIPYVLLLAVIAALGAVLVLVLVGWVTITGIFFALTNIVLISLLFVFAALGGAFVGMIMTHRALANREFSPTERTVLEIHGTVQDISHRLETLEAKLGANGHEDNPAPDLKGAAAATASRIATVRKGS